MFSKSCSQLGSSHGLVFSEPSPVLRTFPSVTSGHPMALLDLVGMASGSGAEFLSSVAVASLPHFTLTPVLVPARYPWHICIWPAWHWSPPGCLRQVDLTKWYLPTHPRQASCPRASGRLRVDWGQIWTPLLLSSVSSTFPWILLWWNNWNGSFLNRLYMNEFKSLGCNHLSLRSAFRCLNFGEDQERRLRPPCTVRCFKLFEYCY